MQKKSQNILSSLVYDNKEQKWKETFFNDEDISLKDIKQLKFLTYNTWFGSHNFDMRGIELRKIIGESDADFICLQEVTEKFWKALLQEDWVREKYYVSNFKMSSYHSILLCKYKSKFFMVEFPTVQNRYLVYSYLAINGRTTGIGSVHLESVECNAPRREKQLKIVFEEFEKFDRAFILGDHNFKSRSENAFINTGYMDMWHELYPLDSGHTKPFQKGACTRRLDRILVKKDNNLELSHIEIIGKNPIPFYKDNIAKEREIVTPSDHFGVVATINLDALTEPVYPLEKISNKRILIFFNVKDYPVIKQQRRIASYKTRYKDIADVIETENIDDLLDKLEALREKSLCNALILDFPTFEKFAQDFQNDFNYINKKNNCYIFIFSTGEHLKESETILKTAKIENGRFLMTKEELMKHLDILANVK